MIQIEQCIVCFKWSISKKSDEELLTLSFLSLFLVKIELSGFESDLFKKVGQCILPFMLNQNLKKLIISVDDCFNLTPGVMTYFAIRHNLRSIEFDREKPKNIELYRLLSAHKNKQLEEFRHFKSTN